jgi:methylmalonyl-CoA/ethylmalonyl-CoA epimerase
VLTGFAHTAICVPDVEEATTWYSTVLGMKVLSPPYLMEGADIDDDMGQLIPPPVSLKASILGFEAGDRVLELIEYPRASAGAGPGASPDLTTPGLTHVGLVCDDLAATRRTLEDRGVRFLTAGIADIVGLRSTWFVDPWGVIFILLEKADPHRPYWRQATGFGPPKRGA